MKEIAYEIVEVTVIMIINNPTHPWRDTGAKNPPFVAASFLLYLLADAPHAYSLVRGFSELKYVIRPLLRLGAPAVLTYSTVVYRG